MVEAEPELDTKKATREETEDEISPAKKIKLEPTEGDIQLGYKIAKQIDYYFSDVNLIKDRFMREEFKKDDGWVKISVLLTFARLKELAKDESAVIKALKEHISQIIVLDEEKSQVRRKNPLPDLDELQKQLNSRTVHISGFPTDYTFEILHKYCSQFGPIESLSMRRYYKSKLFKGCIHVVFGTEASAKEVLEKEVLKCKDRELKRESMDAYYKRKAEMKEKRGKDKAKPKD